MNKLELGDYVIVNQFEKPLRRGIVRNRYFSFDCNLGRQAVLYMVELTNGENIDVHENDIARLLYKFKPGEKVFFKSLGEKQLQPCKVKSFRPNGTYEIETKDKVKLEAEEFELFRTEEEFQLHFAKLILPTLKKQLQKLESETAKIRSRVIEFETLLQKEESKNAKSEIPY